MNALMLVIAAVTLGILIWQEVRRYRERPEPRLSVSLMGNTSVGGMRWEIIEVTNESHVQASITSWQFYGVTLLNSGPIDQGLEYGLPKVMPAGMSIRLAVRGEKTDHADLTEGWVQFIYHAYSSTRVFLEWVPIDHSGPLEAVRDDQWEALEQSRRARRRPKFWTRKYWRDERGWKPAPVGPVDGGRPIVTATRRRLKKHDDLVTRALDIP